MVISMISQIFLIIFLGMVLSPAWLDGAEIYKWVDKNGVIHFTDQLTNVPKEYRNQIEKQTLPSAPPPSSQPPAQKAPQDFLSEPVDSNGHNEKWWKDRMNEWRGKLTQAETKLQELKRKLEIVDRERSLGLGIPGKQLEEKQALEAEIQKYTAEMNTAKSMLEQILPEEARKARAYPGWLR